jgi:hypothetical protein
MPEMDIAHFVTALSGTVGDASGVSLALAGYHVSDTDLREQLRLCGLTVGYVTTDLYVAARWRNDPTVHKQIVALAMGRNPGVSTLAHFPRGDTKHFAWPNVKTPVRPGGPGSRHARRP